MDTDAARFRASEFAAAAHGPSHHFLQPTASHVTSLPHRSRPSSPSEDIEGQIASFFQVDKMDSATISLPGKHPIDTLMMLPDDKKSRKDSAAPTTIATAATLERTPAPSAPASSPAAGSTVASKECSFDALPTVAISHIGSFAVESSLSGACRSALAALPTLHYKINMWSDALSFGPHADPSGAAARGHLGLQASGALATGRAVTQITIIGVGASSDFKNDAGYTALQDVVKRVVRHSIPTLRKITISGGAQRGDGRANGVAHILGELVPLSSKRQCIAPCLTHVHLVAGATAVARAGKAVAAGLWPALEVLTFSYCRANAGHFEHLAAGLSDGLAPRLRMLCWDDQSCIRKIPFDDLILAALARGQCSLIEHLSFTGNHFCPENRIDCLFEALRACPRLLTLRMDCSRAPHLQLRALARALEAGHAPHLEHLFVRATAPHYRDSDVELRALRRAAASREPPVELETEIKTRIRD